MYTQTNTTTLATSHKHSVTAMPLLTSFAIAGVLTFYHPHAQAAEKDGVSCPTGYTAQITNGNNTLTCKRETTYRLDSICPPINNPLHIVMQSTGSDRCLPIGGGNPVPSAMIRPLLGYPDASKFARVTVPKGVDYFQATVTETTFPSGGPFYSPFDKPSLGVTCPAGYNGELVNGGKGIRCAKVEAERVADCDIAYWPVTDYAGNTDKCLGLGMLDTKPKGILGAIFVAENLMGNIKWVKRISKGTDHFQRTWYKYPESRH